MRFFCMLCIGFVVDNCIWNNDKWQNGKNSLLIWKGSVFLSAQLWIVLLQVQLPFLQSVGELLVVCLGQSNGLDQSEVSMVVTWPRQPITAHLGPHVEREQAELVRVQGPPVGRGSRHPPAHQHAPGVSSRNVSLWRQKKHFGIPYLHIYNLQR